MEPVFRIGVKSVHAVLVSNKKNDVYLKSREVTEVAILIAICHTNAFTSQLHIGNLELTFNICIGRRKHIMNRIVVHSLAERIKNLRGQLELFYLLHKIIVLARSFHIFHIITNYLDNLILHLSDCLTVQLGHTKQVCHPI